MFTARRLYNSLTVNVMKDNSLFNDKPVAGSLTKTSLKIDKEEER